jgi:hypothetical protein
MAGRPAVGVTVSEITDAVGVTPELIEAFDRLIPQLSSSSPPPNRAELQEMVGSPASVLLVARDEAGTVIGSLTLVDLPRAHRVAGLDRGRGGGRVGPGGREPARPWWSRPCSGPGSAGARSVDLTSRPSRESANRLYQPAGIRGARHQRVPPMTL